MAKLVRICPGCGFHNENRGGFCSNCRRFSLETIAPVDPDQLATQAAEAAAQAQDTAAAQPLPSAPQPAPAGAVCRLVLLANPGIEFLVGDGQTVGRTDKADVVLSGIPDIEFIHGAHARFWRRGEQWFVQYLGGFNFIRVDGTEYNDNTEVALYTDTELVLSKTAFTVILE